MSWRRSPGSLALALGLAAQGVTTKDTQCHPVLPHKRPRTFLFFKANLVTVYCVHHGVALTQRVQFHTV